LILRIYKPYPWI